jgi:hypothetical protein
MTLEQRWIVMHKGELSIIRTVEPLSARRFNEFFSDPVSKKRWIPTGEAIARACRFTAVGFPRQRGKHQRKWPLLNPIKRRSSCGESYSGRHGAGSIRGRKGE